MVGEGARSESPATAEDPDMEEGDAGLLERLDALSDPVAPRTLHFDSLGSEKITRWHWDFGDGETSSERNPIHQYPASLWGCSHQWICERHAELVYSEFEEDCWSCSAEFGIKRAFEPKHPVIRSAESGSCSACGEELLIYRSYLVRLTVEATVDGEVVERDEGHRWAEPQSDPPANFLGMSWPNWSWITGAALSVVSGFILFYLAWLTWASGKQRVENRIISALLVLEAVGCMTLFLPFGLPASHDVLPIAQLLHNLHLWCYLPAYALYLALAVRQLPFKWSEALWSRPLLVKALFLIALAAGISINLAYWNRGLRVFYTMGRGSLRFNQKEIMYHSMTIYLGIVLLVVMTLLYRMLRAAPKSEARTRLKSYLFGFGLRFGVVVLSAGLLVGISLHIIPPIFGVVRTGSGTMYSQGIIGFIMITYALANLLFGLMFAYGVLRGQILGIDRLFKAGLNRAMMGFTIVIGFFLAEETCQNMVSDDYGWVGGLAVAGIMVVFQDQVMKLINRSTNVVMTVRDHDAADKLEIYREHFQAAIFDGKLSAKDRMMLRITSRTLGLTDEECYLVEAELVPVMSVGSAGGGELSR